MRTCEIEETERDGDMTMSQQMKERRLIETKELKEQGRAQPQGNSTSQLPSWSVDQCVGADLFRGYGGPIFNGR